MSEALRTSTARKNAGKSTTIAASKSNVVQQAKLMDSAGTAWHAVKYGNLEMITRLFPSQCNVYSKGPVGDNVFHIAMLLNTPSTLAIAKYLVKLYGKTLVNTPYQERKTENDPPGNYEGETAIHIAIVNHDFDMVKFLVQNGAECRARAYGSFFNPGSPCYYGEYPLSFAACTGQKDIVSYLKRHGARVNTDRDRWGNTALHMCIYHDQPDMYDHLMEYCGASEHVRNNRSQTPLLLAASLGKVEMFQHIYNKRRKVAWAYGPVTSYSLSLREIDSVQNEGEFVPSALEAIVRKGHLDLLTDPLIHTLLTTKWHRFGGASLTVQFAMYLVLVVIQTFLCWLHSDVELFNSRARFALEIISLILAGLFMIVESWDFLQWIIGVYKRRRLMRSASKYKPALYPIPGEKIEMLEKKNTGVTGVLTRIFGGGKGAVAEGLELPTPATAIAAASRQPHLAIDTAVIEELAAATTAAAAAAQADVSERPLLLQGPSEEITATASAGAGPRGAQQQQQQQQQDEVDEEWYVPIQPGAAGAAVAEGSDAPEAASAAPAESKTSANSAASAPASAASHTANGQDAAARMQALHAQVDASKSSPQTAALYALPSDIVSVGLPMPPSRGFGSISVPSAYTSMAARPTITSMLAPPPEQLPQPTQQPGTAQGGTRPPALQRVSSVNSGGEIGSEIKNRMRGGGGGEMPTGLRAEQRKQATSMEVHTSQEPDAPEAEDDQTVREATGLSVYLRTLLHAYKGYINRMMKDPVMFVIIFHIFATFVHFITWASAYGGIHGDGPRGKTRVAEFDDVVVSMMCLSGWISLLYFTRGFQPIGQLVVLLEHCLLEVAKWLVVYVTFNFGFTLAFYTCVYGTTYTLDPAAANQSGMAGFVPGNPMKNIGYGMIQMVRFLYGEAQYDPLANNQHIVKSAWATMYFLCYVAISLLVGLSLLLGAVMYAYATGWTTAEKIWRLRWASYILRAEARMPSFLQQRFRLGEVSYDPVLQTRVYNHVFEVTEEREKEEAEREKEIKSVEALLERLRKNNTQAKTRQ